MVKPSRLLLVLVCLMCGGTIFVAVISGFGIIGGLPVATGICVALFTVFLAVFGFYHTVRHQKNLHIDISGTGQIRLIKVAAAGSCQEKNWPHVKRDSELVRLLPDSTIWPHLLLLHLQSDDGQVTVVPVLPDCVSRDCFRALSVACRWIAVHGTPAEYQNLRQCTGKVQPN